MKFSKVVVILATLSQAVGPAINAQELSTLDKAKAFICKNYPNDPQCKPADQVAKEQAAAAKAKAEALAIAKKHAAEQEAAAQAQAAAEAKAAAKAAAAAKIAAEQASTKKKLEEEKIVVKTKNDQTEGQPELEGSVKIKSSKGYQGPTRKYDDKKSAEVFQDYCDWNGDLNSTPTADYTNKKVVRAAEVLSQINKDDFYFYGGIKRFYADAAKAGPSQYSENARLFLTQLCGEFRDRPEMIEDKVKWVTRMVRPGKEEQKPIDYARLLKNKETESIWSQMSGYTYKTYLQTSSALWEARKRIRLEGQVNEKMLDKKVDEEAESPVKPTTICETKFIIGEVIINKTASIPQNIEQLRTYNKAYGKFAADPTKCDQEDVDYIYNFRGDANFKHYSPESNGMIWHALSIARFCKTPTQSTGIDKDIDDEACKQYFTAPFLSRYNAARSGLASWLLYDNKYAEAFDDAQAVTFVLPKFGKTVGQLPFSLQISTGDIIDTNLTLSDSTLQFNMLTGLDGSKKKDLKGAFKRLKSAVNRHTNWYKSGYRNIVDDDSVANKPDEKEQAYSPFVASSYEMSKSDAFAGCGYTVPCAAGIQPHKAWMLVFKVHKKKSWYNTNSLADERPLDFDNVWLDETSLGTESLADAERAFDRLGTAINGEFAEIIHLGNLESQSLQPTKIDPIK